MRHRVNGRLFGRTANQRKALLKGVITSLFEHQRIETTIVKAKAVKGTAEKLVTMAKKGDLHSKRVVLSYIPNRKVVSKLFDDIAKRFADRNGGYLRIVKTRDRVKDAAPMAVLEFIDYQPVKKVKHEKKEKVKAKEKEKEKEQKKS
ncbi:MAG: 50S ribosomal protein L17 [Nitrospiraceae bacterium]|nr:50S ribosomal protein L17 [Nitrospiraceae bacterium]